MCGIIGVSGIPDAARLTYLGLYALQHRGQESAGIVAVDRDGMARAHRGMGLVSENFDEPILSRLPGDVAVGHTRYSTTGSTVLANAQPCSVNTRCGTLAIAHNGNLTNAAEIKRELVEKGAIFTTSSDTEVLVHLIARSEAETVEEQIRDALEQVEGAYSLVVSAGRTLYAVVDSRGFRPLVLGRLGSGMVVASETCALDLVGAEYEREVRPGELVAIDEEGLHSHQSVEPSRRALCLFEFIYLARPDSRLAHEEIHTARVRMGEALAREAPADADLVMPVPDSGTPAAIGFARESGIPFSEGLIKNRYVGRTFIQPDQGLREQGIKLKFNPLAEVAGKRVVVVDDSIVRGTTMRQLVSVLREAGATEVHVRVSSPPVISPCFYGIDFGDDRQLVAAGQTVEDTRRQIGATTLAHLSLEAAQEATTRPASECCRACFTREYPTRIPADRTLAKLRFETAAV
jgi:amidophosphoribosyltransferase